MLKTFYLSLVGPLYGYYLEVRAKDAETVRRWANQELGPKVWCCEYASEELQKHSITPNLIGKLVIIPAEQDYEITRKIDFDYLDRPA